jgi:glucose-1-phosphate thymidylyltransferase
MVPADAVLLAPPASSGGALCVQLGVEGVSMLPIANEALIAHQLDALADAGFERVVIVSGRRTAFQALAAARHIERPVVDFIHSAPASGDAAGLSQAATMLGHGPLFVQRGDVLVHGPLESLGYHFGASRLEAAAFDIDGVTAACIFAAGALKDVLTGPQTTLAGLLHSGIGRVEHRPIQGCDLSMGGRTAVLAANRMLLERLRPTVEGARISESEVQGPVIIRPGARVHRSLVRGPAVIGAGAEIDHAYVGPYSAIGARVELEGAEIEHSIVLPGARIRYLDTRLASSIIGRGACVERRLATPRSLELMIAGGAEVRMG